jgi:succinate-semialdehyde dehydrogenase/glutarate-semialdehyde dehydrogenase
MHRNIGHSVRKLTSRGTLKCHNSSYHNTSGLEFVKHKELLPNAGFINGNFTVGKGNPSDKFDVVNPANGKVVAQLPRMGETETQDAIAAAKTAFHSWKETTAHERSKLLERMSQLMNKHKDDLATIMTSEAGKPTAEAKGEINYAISFLDYYAEEAKRVKGDVLASPVKNRRLLTIKQPVGVAGLITPWNFPSAMITRKLAPALAAGCTAVIKPSEETPLSALAICAIAQEAGIPPGVVNCVTVDRYQVEEVGRALCHSSDVRKISFTGSTPVGKWLMRESASNVKKVSLELGGNAPFIVFDDCDVDVAVQALMFAKFRNAGQVCIASNRILVQEGVYEKFATKLTEAVSRLQVGNGFDPSNTVGPLINQKGLAKVSSSLTHLTVLFLSESLGEQPC